MNESKIDIPTRLIPVTRWNDHHEWPPQGGLRYLIFNAETNGFNSVIKRCGRWVLIDEAAFFEWVRRQQPDVKTTQQEHTL